MRRQNIAQTTVRNIDAWYDSFSVKPGESSISHLKTGSESGRRSLRREESPAAFGRSGSAPSGYFFMARSFRRFFSSDMNS